MGSLRAHTRRLAPKQLTEDGPNDVAVTIPGTVFSNVKLK
jgi:hypothetical protein